MSMANISPVQPLPIKVKWVSSNWNMDSYFFPHSPLQSKLRDGQSKTEQNLNVSQNRLIKQNKCSKVNTYTN